MRAYPVLMLTGLVSMILLGSLLSVTPLSALEIRAEVDIDPEVFNLKRNEPMSVITAYISNLTKEDISYDVQNINASTIGLYHKEQLITEAIRTSIQNDVLIAKFDAAQVANYVWTNIVYHMGTIPPQESYPLPLTVSGQLINKAETFSGDDTIKIILP